MSEDNDNDSKTGKVLIAVIILSLTYLAFKSTNVNGSFNSCSSTSVYMHVYCLTPQIFQVNQVSWQISVSMFAIHCKYLQMGFYCISSYISGIILGRVPVRVQPPNLGPTCTDDFYI